MAVLDCYGLGWVIKITLSLSLSAAWECLLPKIREIIWCYMAPYDPNIYTKCTHIQTHRHDVIWHHTTPIYILNTHTHTNADMMLYGTIRLQYIYEMYAYIYTHTHRHDAIWHHTIPIYVYNARIHKHTDRHKLKLKFIVIWIQNRWVCCARIPPSKWRAFR